MFNVEEFKNEYYSKHKCCPNCKSEYISQTLVCYIVDPKHPEKFKDNNYCHCFDCGWNGTVHDLVPKQ